MSICRLLSNFGQPCCGCIRLKIAALIVGIIWTIIAGICTIFAILDVVAYFCDRGTSKCHNGATYHLIGPLCWLAIVALHLACGILLICGACNQRKCKVHFFLFGTVLACLLAIVVAICLGIWCRYSDDREYYYGTEKQCFSNGFFFFALFWVIFLWYPWWVVYAYFMELGGPSWCNCGCT